MTVQVTISDVNRRTGMPAWLSPLAALAYERAKRDGMPGGCVSDAGRTYAEQRQMWDAYRRGELIATAAYPGTSKHERGNALDLREPARSWLRSRPEYGFVKDRVSNEPWHFEHDGTVPHINEIVEEIMSNPDYANALLAAIQGVQATVNNIESILAVQGGNGIRGDIQETKALVTQTRDWVGTVANELRAHDARTQ